MANVQWNDLINRNNIVNFLGNASIAFLAKSIRFLRGIWSIMGSLYSLFFRVNTCVIDPTQSESNRAGERRNCIIHHCLLQVRYILNTKKLTNPSLFIFLSKFLNRLRNPFFLESKIFGLYWHIHIHCRYILNWLLIDRFSIKNTFPAICLPLSAQWNLLATKYAFTDIYYTYVFALT